MMRSIETSEIDKAQKLAVSFIQCSAGDPGGSFRERPIGRHWSSIEKKKEMPHPATRTMVAQLTIAKVGPRKMRR